MSGLSSLVKFLPPVLTPENSLDKDPQAVIVALSVLIVHGLGMVNLGI